MNFSVYNSLPIGQVYSASTPITKPYIPQSHQTDKVSLNRELDKMLDKQVITDMVNSNPAIISILKSQGLNPEINIENFKKTTYRHSVDTRNKAIGIYNHLPSDLKAEANPAYIQKGALLHDIGKVLIPANILNKKGTLNSKEAEIMHLHSRLSEGLLSTQNIEPEVLNIVKYHHQNKNGTGYPQIKNTLQGFDINTEVVALADKYSALTEKRTYKNALSIEDALKIIKQDVDNKNLNPRVYNALEEFIKNTEIQNSKEEQKTAA